MQPSSSTYRPGAVHRPAAGQNAQPDPAARPAPGAQPGPAAQPGLAAQPDPAAQPGPGGGPAAVSAPFPPPRPSRRGRMIAGVVAAALVATGAGGFAVNSYARHAICADVKDAVLPDATTWRGAAEDLRARSRFLLWDRDLNSAALTLAGDLDRMAALEPTVEAGIRNTATTSRLLVLAGTVNAHARTAQQACGLPATGVFGA